MSERGAPRHGPEVLKVARLLRVDPAEVGYLDAVGDADLRALRERLTDVLFEGDGRLRRIADAGRIVPTQLMATIGRRAFGPLLCARLAGLLDPQRAVDVALRWPDEFNAAIAAELDPRRAAAVVAAMPPERSARIAAVLGREREYVAMGRFVGHLPEAALHACVDAIDDEAVVRTGYVLENAERIDAIVARAGDERLARVAEVTVALGLDAQLDHLRAQLSADQDARVEAALRAAAS